MRSSVRRGGEVGRSAKRHRGRDAGALGVELIALSQSHREHPRGTAVAIGMQHGDLLEGAFGLARLGKPSESSAERFVDRLGRRLSLEQPDAEGVSGRFDRVSLAKGGAHGGAVSRVPTGKFKWKFLAALASLRDREVPSNRPNRGLKRCQRP
jgi:hypothetical protein